MRNNILLGNSRGTRSANEAYFGAFTVLAGVLCQASRDKYVQSFGKALTVGGGLVAAAEYLNNSQLYAQEVDLPIWKNENLWSSYFEIKTFDPALKEYVIHYSNTTYQKLWQKMIPSILVKYYELSQSGKLKIDCGDLVFRVLLEFAKNYKLPIHFYDDYKKEKAPEFNNKIGFFKKGKHKVLLKSYKEFRSAIEYNYGSQDIFHNTSILRDVLYEKIQIGDIVSFKYNEPGWYHAQIVAGIDKENIMIYQGNLTEHGGSATPIEKKVYKKIEIKNKTVGQIFSFIKNPIVDIKVRRWNFSYFDNFFTK